MELLGRWREQKRLKHCYQSSESKLVVVYGRRRVGKTFLIRKYFAKDLLFQTSGLHRGNMEDQLAAFTRSIALAGYTPAAVAQPTTWFDAFDLLRLFLETKRTKKKKVLFFDELPWFDTPRSKFLTAFEHFWNSYCTTRTDLLVVACGSAASWMIKKMLHNKGGLHNRVSERIKLRAFTLAEVATFLKYKGIVWSQYDIAQLYIAVGGVPFYLDAIVKGESVAQFIDRACFADDGILHDEYQVLFTSLFDDSDNHHRVVEALATVKQGLRRDDLVAKSRLSSGGTLTKTLRELELSGFIKVQRPYGAKRYGQLYQLSDYFTLFYYQFMQAQRDSDGDRTSWTIIMSGRKWQSWAGLAFERLCIDHITEIKSALGLTVIKSQASTWSTRDPDQGALIDLLIDRADRIVNVCEIKFSQGQYTIDKAYALQLRNKLQAFSQVAKRKTLFLTMITTFGVQDNAYCKELVQSQVTLEDLFAE